ncbi:MAG: hypothetical protein SVO01_00630 [Thermotogota bacterium]|nr:hypothetical protein [Thermotogota bacterium]
MNSFQISDITTISTNSSICFLVKGIAYEYLIDTAILNQLMNKYKKAPGRLFNAIKKAAYDYKKL